ncbi:MAG: NAD-dependent epimerase/dehydratase family protein [Dehalococcoidia bacterium]|nr:NAD-dependent epimerase/dehydratase family protein [Dehalococcoidia bacterium]
MAKKNVLLTGASGSMGGEAFRELLRRKDQYDIVLLLLPKDRKAFAKYEGQEGIRIVWGDLYNFEDVLEAANGVDYVLHPAALIAPEADKNPQLCKRINYSGTENIIAAIKRQPKNGDDVRFVYISSVAAYGDRLPPIHMVRVGDPLKPSVGDFYATTKIAAERAVIESGLKYWAVLRQTYIAIPNVASLLDPILFHQPVNTHIELITSEDAGYGLIQTIEAPDVFYGRVYNMGGGPSCGVVFKDYIEWMMKIFGLGDYRKIMPLNWFALRNFHCCWYEDSWVLNEYLGHWRHSLEDHYKQAETAAPWYLKLGGKIAPSFIIKAFIRRMADPLKWIESNDTEKIKVFFGSLDAWQNIPDWEHSIYAQQGEPTTPSSSMKDRENTPESNTIRDMQELASSRGGQCLSTEYVNTKTKLKWKCAFGHEWEATPRLLKAGHWCPECAAPPWDYDTQAKVDPALAAIYYNNHDREEYQRVDWLFYPSE